MRLWLIAAAFLAGAASGTAQEMAPPRLITVEADWSAALKRLDDIAELRPPIEAPEAALARLNAAMADRFAGVAKSSAPVLVPFDVAALLRDRTAGSASATSEKYLSGFHARTFFHAGPSGYDAAFGIQASDVPDLADIKFTDPIYVHITGSTLIYNLEAAPAATGVPVPELEGEFPGIRRFMQEHYLRYSFTRYGVPYVISTNCFGSSVSRYRLPPCHAAERIAVRFLRALRVAGGTPRPHVRIDPRPIERPKDASPTFTYHPPGRLLPGTGARGQPGRADRTVYAMIRFPLAEAPAFANSQLFYSRNRPTDPQASPNYSYPWHDNFCERRGFPVGQCPAGIGHQGQDIRPAQCSPQPCQPRHDLVAVRDGAILRMPKQEAAYLVVNTETEHIRFRYLHMQPRKMDEDNVLSGRFVREGEVIGQVSNYSRREGGTSYHLHFDVQVPTMNGWVFVSPYMTLVSAYERLLGGRGTEIGEPVAAKNPDGVEAAPGNTEEPPAVKRGRIGARFAYKPNKFGRYYKGGRHHKFGKHFKRKRHRYARS